MKITGLSHLFKWENLHNWWLTKYFFAPLYIYIIFKYFFAPSVSRFSNSCFSAKYFPIITKPTSMESLFIQLSDDESQICCRFQSGKCKTFTDTLYLAALKPAMHLPATHQNKSFLILGLNILEIIIKKGNISV